MRARAERANKNKILQNPNIFFQPLCYFSGMKNIPLAYFITFRTYGSFLHGDARKSVDPQHNIIDTPRMQPCKSFNRVMKKGCLESEFILNDTQRKTVLNSIIETCDYNHWHLYATHVRSNHIHIVLHSEKTVENTMGKIKCYATKYLKKYHDELLWRESFWARHGSTEYIFKAEDIYPVMHYVIEEQGKPMALYHEPGYRGIDIGFFDF